VTYTYYDYLDLPPGASPAQIESSYVSLLERFGYGTTDAGQDMSGLVRMIHSAYEVLSTPEARQRYDADLAQEAAMADAELKASLDQQASASHRRVQNPPASLRNTFAAVAA
jgi:DnaJ-class molecular chaperone